MQEKTTIRSATTLASMLLLALGSAAALSAGGCEEQGPAERAGEQIDEANENAAENAEDAAEEMDETIDEIEDDIDDNN